MRRFPPLSLTGAALAACLLALLIAVPAGASAAKPIKGTPKIVDIEGFAYPTDFSLAHWRAGAVLITRYPKVLPKAFPARIRKLLTFRAIGKLKVFDHGTRIASRRDNGGLPVFAAGHSVYYAHLLIATQKQSDRIFKAFGFERSKRGWPSSQNVHTRASAKERVKARGRTVARSGSKSAQSVNLVGASDPPYVVNGCVIQPNTRCELADLAGANLSEVDLSKADLSDSLLLSTNLSGADLSDADLSGSFLRLAALNAAKLTRANLSGADLQDADLQGADLSGVTFCQTTMPDGSINDSDC